LYAVDFCTKIRTGVRHLVVGGKEVGLLVVSPAAWVDVV